MAHFFLNISLQIQSWDKNSEQRERYDEYNQRHISRWLKLWYVYTGLLSRYRDHIWKQMHSDALEYES